MKVLVVVDGHLYRTPKGEVRSSRIYNYDFFARYLSAFEEVRVAIRIKNVEDEKDFPNVCSGPCVEFYPIEEFRGPKEFLKKATKIRRNAKNAFEGCDCAIFRVPSTVGYLFVSEFEKTKRPYALEVVIDPWDFAAPGNLDSFFRPIIRAKWTIDLKRACRKANGVSYVTKESLQNRYPSAFRLGKRDKYYFEGTYSSVNIPDWFFNSPKLYKEIHSPIRIVHVTNQIGNYVKGHKELIEAVSRLKLMKIDVDVTFVGEGNLVDEFIQFACERNVEENVHFVGKKGTPGEVREVLCSSDIFAFPTHAEGLPRVLIEAMAVGLPAVSTRINGIPELLDDKFLISVGDVEDLVYKIKQLIQNAQLYEEAGENNYEKAHEYREVILQERRREFYSLLKDCVNK